MARIGTEKVIASQKTVILSHVFKFRFFKIKVVPYDIEFN